MDIGTRQSFRERANNCVNVAYNHREIEEAIRQQVKNGRYPSSKIYGDGQAGKRIADILAEVDIKIQKRLMY